jgi:hypothetical protein
MTSLTCGGRIIIQPMKQLSTPIKEDVMNKKQVTLAAAILLAATNISYAQFFYPVLEKITPEKKEKIDRNYSITLESDHQCVVEAALAVVTMVKLDLPSDELPRLRIKIDNLVTSGATPVIRYKAYLASAVFTNPAMFKQEGSLHYNDSNELFAALAERLRQTLLLSSN